MAHDPNEPIDQTFLDDAQYKKRYHDVLDQLRRESAERTQVSLANQEKGVEKASQDHRDAAMKVDNAIHERRQRYGTESHAVLILQMQPSLEALTNMFRAYRVYFTRKVLLEISECLNYQSEPLAHAAELARSFRAKLDDKFNTEGYFMEPVDPIVIPYLAHVNDNGELQLDLSAENPQMTEEDRREFVRQYQQPFQDSITGWINGSHDTETGGQLEVVDVNGAQKVRIHPVPPAAGQPAPDPAAPPVYMSKDQFRRFREDVLQPQLEQRFRQDFLADEPTPPDNGPAAPVRGV
ncbi:MAG: hypothetical protein NXI01_01180 [Gammaproteobacteria bacterium]|nr:hypothetical protein [Gammaproteobacteria bacterium]